MDRKCLFCGNKLIGRIDKKFCDANCRSTYNNAIKSEEELKIHFVNKKLRKNRRILKILCPHGKTIVRKEILDNLTYDFNYFTSIYTASNAHKYYICYDFAFRAIYEKQIPKVLIVTIQSYMCRMSPWK